MTTRQTVVVLGAGPAGLAAAIRLSQAGYAVTLLEERDRLGGAMVAQSPDGDLLDALPPIVFGHQTATLRLLRELGTARLTQLRTPGHIEFRQRGHGTKRLRYLWLPAPLHSILGLAASRGLTIRDLWRALVFLEQTWENNPALPLDLEARRADQWLSEIRQSEGAQVNVWAPLARFLLNSELSGVSAGMLVDVLTRSFLTRRADSRIGIANHSWDQLFLNPAQAWLHKHHVTVCKGTRFEHFTMRHNRINGIRLEDRRTVTADWYVAATPPRRLSALLPEPVITHYATFHQLSKLSDAAGLTVHVWFKTRLSTPRLLLLVGHTFHWLVVRHADQAIVVTLVATGRADLLHHTDEALGEFALTDVHTAIPDLTGVPALRTHVIRRERACLVTRPGATAFRPVTASPIPNLLLAGGWTDTGLPDSIESAVVSADRCAALLTTGRIGTRKEGLGSWPES
ncbi:carotene 7,8-desaturase [Nitrospira sp.]|nr:carotene 7,8-desaturase [Nitrospira sp.]